MLPEAISWENTVWVFCTSIPLQMVTLYLEMRILTIHHAKAFWIIEGILALGLFPFRMLIPPAIRVFLASLTIIILPVLFSTGGLLLRVVVGILVFLLQMIAEIPASIVWTLLTDTAYANEVFYRDLPLAYSVTVLTWITLIVLLVLLRWFVNKFTHADMAESPLVLPVVIAMVQPVLFFLASVVVIRYEMIDLGVPYVSGTMFVVAVIQVAAVVMVFISADQYASKRTAEFQAHVLAEGVEQRLESYTRVAQNIERVAKIRHDLRNQVQAVMLAAEYGEYERARDQVEEMLDVMKTSGIEEANEGSVDK